MNSGKKTETEIFKNSRKLKELRIEHQDLDQVISRLIDDSYVDQIMLKHFKKCKLMIKDIIARLESDRIPSLNA